MKCEYVTLVWWFRGGSTNNPLGSIVISILKDSYPPPSPLPVWDIRVRNLKQQNPKWWISKWRRCQERVQRRICVAALHLCHHSALSVDMSSSSCGPTSASNHFDFQAIHKKNSQTEQWKLERSKNSDMAVTALHDQKCSNSGAPRTGTRSGRLHKARWEKEANDGLLHASFLLWLFVILFSFHCITCFSNKSFGGVVG